MGLQAGIDILLLDVGSNTLAGTLSAPRLLSVTDQSLLRCSRFAPSDVLAVRRHTTGEEI